jgi:hypothetical protein
MATPIRLSWDLPKWRWISKPARTEIIDYLGVGDVGTVVNPRSLHAQILGGSILGLGHGFSQRWQYDQHYGVPVAKRFYQEPADHDSRCALSERSQGDALNIPDPETPVGAAWRRRAAGRRRFRRDL